jgi:hypothetical protein
MLVSRIYFLRTPTPSDVAAGHCSGRVARVISRSGFTLSGSRVRSSIRRVASFTLSVLFLTGCLSAPVDRADVAAESAVGEVVGRLWTRDASGSIVPRPLPEHMGTARSLVALQPVIQQDLHGRLREAGAARAAALADGARAPVSSRLVTEDLTRRANVAHVAITNYTEAVFATLMARVGLLEGFSVVARVPPESPWADALRGTPNLALIELPDPQYVWTEDVTEIAVDGAFRMTARVGDRGLLRRSVFIDRVRRFYPEVRAATLEELAALPPVPGRPPGELPPAAMRRFPDVMFMIQGVVERDAGQEVAAALAAARAAPLREATTYLEGGNVLLGTLPGGEPYALVGRDSAAVSRALLERHRGRAVREPELIAAMAADLGVPPARLFLVEQPWVFHLDMAMMLLAPGTVVLNDALEAFRLQTRWLREDHEAWRPQRETFAFEEEYRRNFELWRWAREDLDGRIRTLWKYTRWFVRFEARARADLEAAGLTVLRVAGRFPHPARPWDRDVMNFLNGEVGMSPRGGTYFITQGGDPRAERYIAQRLLEPDTGLDRLYLAPRLASRDSLWDKAGIGCHIKVEGEVAPSTR